MTTYKVRWFVARKPFKEPFRTAALAESFRAELMSAARRGEAFGIATGRPLSMTRISHDVDWYRFACDYMDMKWPTAAATYRRSISEALTAITVAFLEQGNGGPEGLLIRSALHGWAFNTNRRSDPGRPAEVNDTLRWVESHTKPVSQLSEPAVLRSVLAAIGTRIDGSAAAPSVESKRRRVLFNALEYAVERRLIQVNPLPAFKWKQPKSSGAIDKRSVVNPVQARTLLRAVREARLSGPRLVAFFGLMYFSALRPEEAANVRSYNLALPAEGWGELHIHEATPYAGTAWTNDGNQRDRRQLKNRARGDSRTVPCPPELTVMLHDHIREFGTGVEGRLFPGERADELPKLTYMRVWRAARLAAFSKAVHESPLARTPYDLRHACVSTWLNGGVPATQVAEWAGHSVEVLLKVYAKCLDGHDELARRRVQEALGHGPT
ncbi:MAG: site-specific integrase [Pseudonocardiaceae bacterium]